VLGKLVAQLAGKENDSLENSFHRLQRKKRSSDRHPDQEQVGERSGKGTLSVSGVLKEGGAVEKKG